MLDEADWLLVEADVEEAMAAHQEPDGSYACDVHVMVAYVRDAMEQRAREGGWIR